MNPILIYVHFGLVTMLVPVMLVQPVALLSYLTHLNSNACLVQLIRLKLCNTVAGYFCECIFMFLFE